LRSVALDFNDIGSQGAEALASVLARCPFLESLTLSHNPVGDAGLYFLLRGVMNKDRKAYASLPLPSAHPLRQRTVEEVSSDEDSEEEEDDRGSVAKVRLQLEAIEKKEQLHGYTTARSERKKRGTAAGGWVVHADSEEEVWAVSLSRRLFKFKLVLLCASTLLALRKRGHPLSLLDVSHCELTADAGAMVACAVRDRVGLSSLYLGGNALGDLGVAAIAQVLPGSLLRHLSLCDVGLTAETLDQVVRAASQTSSLTGLDLSENPFESLEGNLVASLGQTFVLDHGCVIHRDGVEPPPLPEARAVALEEQYDYALEHRREESLGGWDAQPTHGQPVRMMKNGMIFDKDVRSRDMKNVVKFSDFPMDDDDLYFEDRTDEGLVNYVNQGAVDLVELGMNKATDAVEYAAAKTAAGARAAAAAAARRAARLREVDVRLPRPKMKHLNYYYWNRRRRFQPVVGAGMDEGVEEAGLDGVDRTMVDML
jgi:hypothetical protein